MQLQTTTDYGIRVMCCLYNRKDLVTATNLSELLCISYPYLVKVLDHLRRANMIEVTRGRLGGYRIVENAKKITLYEIIKAMEGEIWVNACLSKEGACTRSAIDKCPVHKILRRLQTQLVNDLNCVSLSEIAGDSWKESLSKQAI